MNNTYVSSISNDATRTPIENYAEILENFGLAYTTTGYYLQVNEIKQVQGWILHISVIRSQIPGLLNVIIPILIDNNIPFKITRDKDTAKNLLDGNLGNSQIGKVVSIYPDTNEQTVYLAKELIDATGEFKGPAILTDIHLGAVVYTRYGSFNPMIMLDASGNEYRFIYNNTGELIKDECSIPFQMPAGVEWPFGEIAQPLVPKPKKILKQIYKPISNLKTDPRGDVIKALYLRRLYDVRWCVIKQGTKNMWSDENGRDIPDRLVWQHQLHKQLEAVISLPKVLDLFNEDETTYLAMEYCKGKSLHTRVLGLNKNSTAWYSRLVSDRIIVLGYILKIIDILDALHANRFVHRDVTPVNFLINKKDQLIPIDLELAYSIDLNTPDPPFFLGTRGFMSPEQEALNVPTIKEDIYGLGATMIVLLAGLSPIVFSTENPELLFENLNFFIHEEPISRIVTACLNTDPRLRPDLAEIKYEIIDYRNKLQLEKKLALQARKSYEQSSSDNHLRKIIDKAIQGLCSSNILMADDLWVSASVIDDLSGKRKEEFSVSPGLHHGLSGVIYLLAKLHSEGFDISSCEKHFKKSWNYIDQNYLQDIGNNAPGLHGGAAGMILALVTAIKSGLIEDKPAYRQIIEQSFKIENNVLELANGIVGMGIVALQCKGFIDEGVLQSILEDYFEKISAKRNKNGYWVSMKGKYGLRKNATSFPYGNSGITWFLLEYASQHKDEEAKKISIRSVKKLCGELNLLKRQLKKHGFHKTFQNKLVWDGITGILLVLMKAYETENNPAYKKIAEEMLSLFPASPVADNFDQENGLAGLGELYLEAWRVFKKNEWKERADWIANLFLHTCHTKSNSCYWLGNNSIFPTADFMIGNGGMIHFLMSFLTAGIGYRLLK